MECPPTRIFVEMTRSEDEKGDKGRKDSRAKQLIELYKNVKDDSRNWEKEILAANDDVATLIFDEIDAGISGKTAWKVSEKLGQLSKNHQIICITHLPQIAAMADTHFKIEKMVENESTKTKIQQLDYEKHIQEIARMVGGDDISEAAVLNAKELVEQSGKTYDLK